MPITYVIDQHHRIVLVDVAGPISVPDIIDVAGRIRRDPFFRPQFSSLVDLSNTAALAFTAADFTDFAAAKHDPFQPGMRRAIVATRPDSYGVARMYQSASGDLNIAIFRSRDEALAWLGHSPVNNG